MSWLKLTIAILVGLGLAAFVVETSLIAYLAQRSPEHALALSPRSVAALTAQADQVLIALSSEPATPGSGDQAPARALPADAIAQIAAHAKVAAAIDPLNARALRLLGQAADLSGDKPRAKLLMTAALRRSMTETVAAFWLMQTSHQEHDFEGAARYADLVLRTRPQLLPQVLPYLAAMAEEPAATDSVKRLLATRPPWADIFYGALPDAITDARTPLSLMLSANASGSPPSTEHLRLYLNFLVKHELYQLAYYAWLQFLPPEQLASMGLLYNGRFETAPSGLPFDWTIKQGSGVTVSIVETPTDEVAKRALLIEFGLGRADFPGITQMLVLAPGPYQFSAKFKGEIATKRGLQWRVVCFGGSHAVLGDSPPVLGSTKAWKPVTLSFTVPAENCIAQQVQLFLDARSTSEQFVTGSVWFSDLQIARP